MIYLLHCRYCNEHALKATLARNKQNSKYPPPNTAEVLLQSLSHYVKKPRNRTIYPPNIQHIEEGGRTTPDDTGETKVTKSLDPFRMYLMFCYNSINSIKITFFSGSRCQ